MTENEALKRIKMCIGISPSENIISSFKLISDALEELQTYRAIENELKEKYRANVDIPLLMKCFIDTVFEGEKHEGFCILTNEDRAMWDAYRAIGTVEECQKSVDICKAMIERNITPETIEEYIKFEDECVKKGFTIKSLLEAREKAEPKKPIRNDLCTCPSCGTHNEVIKKRRNTVVRDIVYCWHCGQAIECQRDIGLD